MPGAHVALERSLAASTLEIFEIFHVGAGNQRGFALLLSFLILLFLTAILLLTGAKYSLLKCTCFDFTGAAKSFEFSLGYVVIKCR